MSLAGSLGTAGTLRLALCSFQYSRQCRSWEWMKRHMSQAWAAHTSSSTHSLQSKVLKFPLSGSKAWFSMRASPKPMASTARVRMKRRVTPNTAAQALNLLAGVEKGRQPLGPVREPYPLLQKRPQVGRGLKGGRVGCLRDEVSRIRCSRKTVTSGCHLQVRGQCAPRAGPSPSARPQGGRPPPSTTYSFSLFSSAK